MLRCRICKRYSGYSGKLNFITSAKQYRPFTKKKTSRFQMSHQHLPMNWQYRREKLQLLYENSWVENNCSNWNYFAIAIFRHIHQFKNIWTNRKCKDKLANFYQEYFYKLYCLLYQVVRQFFFNTSLIIRFVQLQTFFSSSNICIKICWHHWISRLTQ